MQTPPDQEPGAPGTDNPLYPAELNPEFGTLDRPLTEEEVAGSYNNFYEFTQSKQVHLFVDDFETRPWTVEVSGLVEKPATFDIDDLVRRMPLEERLYRFRCVEAWSMAVPWTGFPVRALIDLVQAALLGEVRPLHQLLRHRERPRPVEHPGTALAVRRGAVDAGGAQRADHDGDRHLRARAAGAARRPDTADRALEVRHEEHQVGRPHRGSSPSSRPTSGTS